MIPFFFRSATNTSNLGMEATGTGPGASGSAKLIITVARRRPR